MSILFASYDSKENFVVTNEIGIFGAKANHNSKQIRIVRIGNFGLIRDLTLRSKRVCRFFPPFFVIGDPFDEADSKPRSATYQQLVWPNEIRENSL